MFGFASDEERERLVLPALARMLHLSPPQQEEDGMRSHDLILLIGLVVLGFAEILLYVEATRAHRPKPRLERRVGASVVSVRHRPPA